ncbi:hypothetical protein IMZ48_34390 [Candidatus Bathyarchaeota archaeon]|nr:hypothetical protein [Candidatus Bathyarchaeota archaeon]
MYAQIGDSLRRNTRELSWNDCPDCKTGKQYDFIIHALAHINDKHIKPVNGLPDAGIPPPENPSLCWISSNQDVSHADLYTWRGCSEVRDFIYTLRPISKLCEELFYCVTRPHAPSDGNRSAPSLLPTALTSAFCSILTSYLFLAKMLSLINRAEYWSDQGAKSTLDGRINRLRTDMDNSFQQASRYLEKARLDIIILCTTRREVDCLRMQSVDVHLLAIAFLQNIQTFELPGDKSQDLLQVYRKYLSVLRGRASRRPQRRVFLDIQGFQEELDALRDLTSTQMSVAEKYLSLLYPGSFRVTNTARVERYGAEYEMWKKVNDLLEDRQGELDKLTEQSRRLKDDVKQAIEILEEDHGKAIRVFTVVTLFFLPL